MKRSPHDASDKRSLDIISVAEPCTLEWDTMLGSGAVRYCRLCKKNVYDLSDMSRAEAEELVFAHGGDLCVRFYRRADGTVMTEDCAPTRTERARRASRRALGAVGAAFALGLGAVASLHSFGGSASQTKRAERVEPMSGKFPKPIGEPEEPGPPPPFDEVDDGETLMGALMDVSELDLPPSDSADASER